MAEMVLVVELWVMDEMVILIAMLILVEMAIFGAVVSVQSKINCTVQ